MKSKVTANPFWTGFVEPRFCAAVFCCYLFAFVCLIGLIGCKESNNAKSNQTKPLSKQIFAVSYPLQFLTQRLIGDSVEVASAAAATGDPRTSRPSKDAIVRMQSADLIIANGTGATYANWLDTVSLPDSKIVNTASRALSLKDFIAIENKQIVHSHGPEGEHSHPVMAARTWLDPAMAKKQAGYIAGRLKKVYPELAAEIDTNLKTLGKELDKIKSQLAVLKSKELTVLTADSYFKFLTRAMGAKDITIDQADDEKADAFEKTIEELKPDFALVADGAELPKGLGEALTSKGIPIVKVNLLDLQTDGDYLTSMRKTAKLIADSVSDD